MKQEVMLSGWAFESACAESFPALVSALHTGKYVEGERWSGFISVQHAFQPYYVPVPQHNKRSVENRIKDVIVAALKMAALSADALQDKRVRIYLPGIGMRAEVTEFILHMDHNDADTLFYSPGVKKLHASVYSQDRLARALLDEWRLAWPPASVYCASNSAMAAIHLAKNSIACGQADLVIVAGWTQLMPQDVAFLAGQSMLAETLPQPFSPGNNSVMPADGAMALVLESRDRARRRGFTPLVRLCGTSSFQSSGARGSSSFSADFRAIIHTLKSAMDEAGITPEQVGCIIPHGNGMAASDKAEAMAIRNIWGEYGIPVISYKGQIGYFSTCSALVDMMLASDMLQQKRIIGFTPRQALDDKLMLQFYTGLHPKKLDKNYIISSGMGLDGSVMAAVMQSVSQEAQAHE